MVERLPGACPLINDPTLGGGGGGAAEEPREAHTSSLGKGAGGRRGITPYITIMKIYP